jgi:hypothetical protein
MNCCKCGIFEKIFPVIHAQTDACLFAIERKLLSEFYRQAIVSFHERDILKIKAIRSKDIYDWAAFMKARNSVNNEIKFAKKAHYMNAFHENESNVKKTWGIINELTSKNKIIHM